MADITFIEPGKAPFPVRKRKSAGKAAVSASDAAKATATRERIMQTVFPPMVKVDEMNDALGDLRHKLFEAMGIVRMASNAIQESSYKKAETDAWTSLDVAHTLLCNIADRLQSSESLLSQEVTRGEY